MAISEHFRCTDLEHCQIALQEAIFQESTPLLNAFYTQSVELSPKQNTGENAPRLSCNAINSIACAMEDCIEFDKSALT